MTAAPEQPPPFASSPRTRVLWRLGLVLALPMLTLAPARAADAVVGNGIPARETRAIAEFGRITLSGGLSLRLRQGSPASLVVHGDSNLLPLIEAFVDGQRVLQLRWRPGTSVRPRTPVGVEVVAPQVEAVASVGSGDVEIDNMKVARLALTIKGSGDIDAKRLDTDALTVGIAGSGDLKLAGRAARLTIDLAGSGSIDASDLRCDDVTVGIAGSGDAIVHASRKLAASIAGSGNVLYSGDPSVQRAIAGSGSVRKR